MLTPVASESTPPPPGTLLDNLPQGVYYVDHNRRIIHWSPAAERMTGWREEEVVGRFWGMGSWSTCMRRGNLCAASGARC